MCLLQCLILKRTTMVASFVVQVWIHEPAPKNYVFYETGLCAHNLLTILRSTIDVIGATHVAI